MFDVYFLVIAEPLNLKKGGLIWLKI
jgi:hypothetical protein